MDRYPLAGYSVGRVGFGAMQLPGPGVFGPPRDRDEALAVLRRVIELGINHIDTSQYYGPDVANELIREALHPYPTDLAIVSKVGARRDDAGAWLPWDDPADLRKGIEDNLACLGVERLAAVNLRILDEKEAPGQRFDDQVGAMVEAREAGLIAGIGLSNITVEHLRRAQEQTEIVCVQNPYNLLDRTSAPLIAECAAAGIAFVPFFPLGSGFNAHNPVLNHEQVRAAAERLGIGASQVVLAWTLTVAPDVLLIPGTSSVAHLEENTAVRDVVLPDDVVAELNALG